METKKDLKCCSKPLIFLTDGRAKILRKRLRVVIKDLLEEGESCRRTSIIFIF